MYGRVQTCFRGDDARPRRGIPAWLSRIARAYAAGAAVGTGVTSSGLVHGTGTAMRRGVCDAPEPRSTPVPAERSQPVRSRRRAA